MPIADNGISQQTMATRRTIIDLPDVARDQLDALCQLRGISRAEGVRQAVQAWLDHQQPDHGLVFGLWRHRAGDALSQERSLRGEWNSPASP
jgi:hypothetical protein